ncbi:hypothetical protein ACFE04_001852 [Oxalis oulophora]
MKWANFSIQLLFVVSVSLFSLSLGLKIGETCSLSNNTSTASTCDAGLRCEACLASGNTQPTCTRIRPTNPTSKVKGLAFNKYSWLTTHNSYANPAALTVKGPVLLTPLTQEDSITIQLSNGVRGLMLDMYDFKNDVWLCHSTGSQCYDFTAFQPAIDALKQIEIFLKANQSEIVTIFIEDYVTSPNGLTKVFNASGLSNYLLPVSRMPKNGEDWPTVDDMVSKNQRLVVFTSKSAKEAAEGIAYQWNYVVESQYGDEGMIEGSCPNRAESSPMETKTRSLVLQNYFPTSPNASESCLNNSAPLQKMMNTCYEATGKRWPNFIALDFYKRSDGGGVADTIDKANGQLTCGCDSVAFCKANAKFGTCDIPPPPPPAPHSPPPAASPSTAEVEKSPSPAMADVNGNPKSPSADKTNSAYLDHSSAKLWSLFGLILTMMVSLRV